MVEITKKEAFEMRKLCGDWAVNMSKSKHPKYYLVEDYKNLKILEEYRKKRTVSK